MADAKNVAQAKSIDQINMETAELNRQLAEASLEMKKQELEDMKFKNEEARQRRSVIQAKLKNAAESDRRMRADKERKQIYCNHSQGGEGLEGLFLGEGSQSTYQKETTILGHPYFRCIRCENEVYQSKNPKEFERINKLPHKGLRGPQPILFKFVDNRGNQVIVDENGNPI
jgi:hypothetical protein